MSLSPQSQVLLRNVEMFDQGNWLVINPADSELFRELADVKLDVLHQYFDVFATASGHHTPLQLDSRDVVDNPAGFELIIDKQHHQHCFAPFTSKHAHYSDIVIYLPKAKAHARMLIAMAASALALDGTLYLVGENKGGIKSAGKLLDQYGPVSKVDSARHCSLLACSVQAQVPAFTPADWMSSQTYELPENQWNVCSLPGVFSHGELDKGTQLLLEKCSPPVGTHLLDFACGAGVVGTYLHKKHPQLSLTLSDVSALAIFATANTLQQNQLSGHLVAANGLHHWNGKFSTIVTNPPFHTGINTDYKITADFIRSASQFLSKGGRLELVANRFLPYPDLLSDAFGQVFTLTQDNQFSVYQVSKT